MSVLGFLLKREQCAEAEQCYRAALAIDPRLADAHTNLGFFLLNKQRDDPAGAEACFREALAIDPDDAPARRGLGRVLELLADSEIPYFR